jgi:hypothetical protein
MLLLLMLVIAGVTGASVTISVKSCFASGNTPLLTVIENAYVPVGIVPAIVIMPFVLLMLTSVGAPEIV